MKQNWVWRNRERVQLNTITTISRFNSRHRLDRQGELLSHWNSSNGTGNLTTIADENSEVAYTNLPFVVLEDSSSFEARHFPQPPPPPLDITPPNRRPLVEI